MSDKTAGLRRKIKSAGDLRSVVRTMKAMAASGISQYEHSVAALAAYYRTVEQGLGACLREIGETPLQDDPEAGEVPEAAGAIIFGSDQGMVGRFNEVIADYAALSMATLRQVRIWAVGERVYTRLQDKGLSPIGLFAVPGAIQGVTLLVGQLLVEVEGSRSRGEIDEVRLFRNRPTAAMGYRPVEQRLLPLDENWQRRMAEKIWPAGIQPEVVDDPIAVLQALIHEYLFVSLFRASAESLASENASRLAAMERADKNIEDLLESLTNQYHRLRQGSIDAELFDVVSGFEAFRDPKDRG